MEIIASSGLRFFGLRLARERTDRSDAGDGVLVDQLLLPMVLQDHGVAVESADDAGESLAADEVYVDSLGFLPELIEKRYRSKACS
jgi:hypothetical protein